MKAAVWGLLALAITPSLAKAEAQYLLIGDSHTVGTFGEQMVLSLGGVNNVHRYAISGANAGTWLKDPVCSRIECPYNYGYATPKEVQPGRPLPAEFPGLASLLKKNSGAKVVIALGTNDAVLGCERPMSPAMYKNVKALLAMLPKNSDCVWVGPTQYRRGLVFKQCGENYDLFVNNLKSIVEKSCRFIDSRLVRDAETGRSIEADAEDEMHFSKRLGSFWARTIAPKVRAISAE